MVHWLFGVQSPGRETVFAAVNPRGTGRQPDACQACESESGFHNSLGRQSQTLMRFLGNDLWFLCGLRGVMHHRIGVFDADPVSSRLLFEQAHEIVVVFLLGPIALPFEQGANGGQTHCAGLYHA